MFIRQVRFKNLNSLLGEWDLDFTDPAILSEGIIAITGPTGAGKSTILDAISLALYGRTPRLSNINQSGNEIMSRRTGECFAELSFETPAGVFRCHWSQRRAKGRSDGRLQAQKQELVDARSGEILASKLQDVAERVQAITGMDFERFTRTMFLAQGNFAAFLLARADERAPILEQITGTGIYSEISKRVHERSVDERKKLDELHVLLGAFQGLSPEEERDLRHLLEQKQGEAKSTAALLSSRNREAVWLQRIASLEEELRQLDLRRQSWQLRMEGFAPQREKLKRARQALELTGLFFSLEASRREQEAESKQQLAWEAEARLARVEVAQNAAKAGEASAELGRLSELLQQALPLLQKVRELDLQLLEKKRPLKASEEDLAKARSSLQDLKKIHEQDALEVCRLKQELDKVLRFLDERKQDEELIGRYEGLRVQSDLICAVAVELQAKEEKKALAVKALEESALLLEQKRLLFAEAGRNQEKIGQELERTAEELARLLAGKALEEWREKLAAIREKLASLEKIAETKEAFDKARRTLLDLGRQQDSLHLQSEEIRKTLPEREEVLEQMERNRDLLEKQLVLLQKIGSYEDERALLVPGGPCPLCGAVEHPFARTDIPEQKGTANELGELRNKLKTCTKDVEGMKMRGLALQKDSERLAVAIQGERNTMASCRSLLLSFCAPLALDADAEDLAQLVIAEKDTVGREQSLLARRIQDGIALHGRLETGREAQAVSVEALRQAEAALAQTQYENKVNEESVYRVSEELNSGQVEHRARLDEMTRQLQPFGLRAGSPEELHVLLGKLAERRDAFIDHTKQKLLLEQALAALEQKTLQQAEQVQKEEQALADRQSSHSRLLSEYALLREARMELFGEKKPDEENEKATKNVADARQTLDIAKTALEQSMLALSGLEARLKSLAVSMDRRRKDIDAQAFAFGEQLSARQFASEEEFLSACLAEEERQALALDAQHLSDEEKLLASQDKQNRELLLIEKNKRLTEVSLNEVLAATADLQDRQEQIQQEIGAILRKQQEHEEGKRKREDQLQAVEKQKAECARWDMLHELIGSADGKKFRNFAQGLTFELLISHANKQLACMSDRYLLLHSPGSPLEFSVIDNYQAGEVRTAKNLSGGESFIVSLALALGLSRMAGSTIQAGSLFLDEGFGSLDEESLDVALDALGGLRQEGKLIVVISHVQALKERMGARIRVNPVSGGRSRISGPGVQGGGSLSM